MMICGIELTGSDAVVCLLEQHQGQFRLPECRVRKISLKKNHTREDLKQFQTAFTKLMEDYRVDRVVIKERMTKGKFAGGALSFKMEAAIQLISGTPLEVTLVTPSLIKATLAAHPLPIAFSDTGLKGFQEAAFVAAYVGHLTTLSLAGSVSP